MISYYQEHDIYDDDYQTTDDDWCTYDGDDSVCDDWRDGLTSEESAKYEQELKDLNYFRSELIGALGYSGFKKWTNQVVYQR